MVKLVPLCAVLATAALGCSTSLGMDGGREDLGVDAPADVGADGGVDAFDAAPPTDMPADIPCGPGNFDSVSALPRTVGCATDDDCAFAVLHDCCHASHAEAVRADDAARYADAIAACEATIGPPRCGCAQSGYADLPGYEVYGLDPASVRSLCFDGVCRTMLVDTAPCALVRCAGGQTCGGTCLADGDGGTVALRTCLPVGPDGGTCDAVAPSFACARGGGTCADADGGFTCSCP